MIGRNTSGVKMINLDDGVTVARIAKVREKISDGTQEFDDVDQAAEKVNEDSEEEDENIIFPTESDEEDE